MTCPSPSLLFCHRSSSMLSSVDRPTSGVSDFGVRGVEPACQSFRGKNAVNLKTFGDALEFVAAEILSSRRRRPAAVLSFPKSGRCWAWRASAGARRYWASRPPRRPMWCRWCRRFRRPRPVPELMPIRAASDIGPSILVIACDRLQRGMHGADRIVLMRVRPAEKRHDSVAHIAGDPSSISSDRGAAGLPIGGDEDPEDPRAPASRTVASIPRGRRTSP